MTAIDYIKTKKTDPVLEVVFGQLQQQGREKFFASLYLVAVDWEKTPLTVLAKLIEYEAVHRMESLEDLRVRLRQDRRIYAFFHPDAPHEPLIFVQVAFTRGIPNNIQILLDSNQSPIAVHEADKLVFYSISNAQEQLKGIHFGHYLIERVVAEIAQEFSHIKTFATLSPIPGFMAWFNVGGAKALISDEKCTKLTGAISGNWAEDRARAELIRPLLMRLCTHYILHEKERDRPLDPVTNFHSGNGAVVEKLHWLADTSPKGLAQSAGMMVSYLYPLDAMDKNRKLFNETGKVVASEEIQDYL